MQLIRRKAYARAGLVGNPSDGYHGKTISISVTNLAAEVVLYEWDRVEVVLSQEDRSAFRSVHELVDDVQLHGYYGGVRLVKATIKRFVDFCRSSGLSLHRRNFAVRYQTSIPRQVGLGGSSAIIVATLRALMEFYEVDIPLELRPSLALSVETDELGIAAGLQDRVIQVYEGAVFMDFARERMQTTSGLTYGAYESLDPARLPPLYVAYRADASEPTEKVHNDLRQRYERGDADVLAAMSRWAELATEARDAILAGDGDRLGRTIDENFDLRRNLLTIPKRQQQIVDVARQCGATAKFAGSGGAIVGTYPDPAAYQQLVKQLGMIGCRVLKPRMIPTKTAASGA